jgi:predicted HTH domain antitoxin
MQATIEMPPEITTCCKVRKEELAPFLKKKIAIELYREGAVSLGKAAEIAGLERIDMMDTLRQMKVPIQYGVEELKEDIKTLGI